VRLIPDQIQILGVAGPHPQFVFSVGFAVIEADG
jgi:hypothetical protein